MTHIRHLVFGKGLQSESYLLTEQSVEFLHPHTNKILLHIRAVTAFSEIAGEDDGLHQFDDSAQAVEPWQLAVLLGYVGVFAAIGIGQQRYILSQKVCDFLVVHSRMFFFMQKYSILT